MFIAICKNVTNTVSAFHFLCAKRHKCSDIHNRISIQHRFSQRAMRQCFARPVFENHSLFLHATDRNVLKVMHFLPKNKNTLKAIQPHTRNSAHQQTNLSEKKCSLYEELAATSVVHFAAGERSAQSSQFGAEREVRGKMSSCAYFFQQDRCTIKKKNQPQ